MARENPGWGAPRVTGELRSLGYHPHPDTIRRIFLKHGLNPSPGRGHGRTWAQFIAQYQSALAAADFFTTEVWERGKLSTYYCLFFMHIDTRQVHLAGVTRHPDEAWMLQMARNLSMEGGFLKGRRWLILDRDSKFTRQFKRLLSDATGPMPVGGVPKSYRTSADASIHCLTLPPCSPNLNAFAERWVRSIKEECLNEFPIWSEDMLWKVLKEYLAYYHHERPHQGMGNEILFPLRPAVPPQKGDRLQCKSRLGGILNSYYWERENEEKKAA
jgi:transposase InsO family protein